MLKATSDGQSSFGGGGMDPVQNARVLGVEVQLANIFLKDSNKLLHKLRHSKGDRKNEEEMEGISPLKWKSCDKENYNIIKLEDEDRLFKPSLKYFDNLPQIRYDADLISPFDKNGILHRKSEKTTTNRYSVNKKWLPTSKKGGFCEACDYWFKCSLREHLNSEKHAKFVKKCANYEKLDEIISKMPSFKDFISRFPSPVKSDLGSTCRQQVTSREDSLSLIAVSPHSEEKLDKNASAEVEKNCVDSNDHNAEHVSAAQPDNQVCEIEKAGDLKNVENPIGMNQTLCSPNKDVDAKSSDPAYSSSGTEFYYHGSANESVTRDCDSQETKDSGTGPEILDDITVDSKDEPLRNCPDSDSAFPVDLSTSQHSHPCGVVHASVKGTSALYEDTNCDNAVFCNTGAANDTLNLKTLSFEGAFTNSGLDDKNPHRLDTLNSTSKQVEVVKAKCAAPLFSPVTSPTSDRSGRGFDFAQLTMNWMSDMSKSHASNSVGTHSSGRGESQGGGTTTHISDSRSSVSTNPIMANYNLYLENEGLAISSSVSLPLPSNPWTQDTPMDLSKTSQMSVISRKLAYGSVQKTTTNCSSEVTDEISLISLPSASKHSRSGMLEESENSCSSVSGFTSDSSMKESLASSTVGHFSAVMTPKMSRSTSSSVDIMSEVDTPKGDDSVFLSNNDTIMEEANETSERQPIKLKISVSSLKEKIRKPKKLTKRRTKRQLVCDSESTDSCDNVYYACQQSETRIKLCKVVMTPLQQNGDLRKFWKVRKSGGCRLVFSSEKRKAERLDSNSSDVGGHNSLHASKRRRLVDCL